MNKNILSKSFILLLSVFAISFAFISCGKENLPVEDVKPDETPQKELVEVEMEFDFKLSEVCYKYFDFTVEYTSEAGIKTFAMTENWKHSFKVPYSKDNNTFTCKVTKNLKSEFVDCEDEISCVGELEIITRQHYSDGSDEGLRSANNFIWKGKVKEVNSKQKDCIWDFKYAFKAK